jgi:hypothetical protein
MPRFAAAGVLRRWACIAARSASAATAKTLTTETASQHPAAQQQQQQHQKAPAAPSAPTAAAASSGCSTPPTWQRSAAIGSWDSNRWDLLYQAGLARQWLLQQRLLRLLDLEQWRGCQHRLVKHVSKPAAAAAACGVGYSSAA